jgi:hypothetical protein
MNALVYIKIFNDILDKFFNYLEDTYPDQISDLILTKSTINMIRMSNPRLIVEQFVNTVGPYSKEIFACNENFFLRFNNINGIEESSNFTTALKLREIWLESDDIKKATIFYYFQKMLKSSDKCKM